MTRLHQLIKDVLRLDAKPRIEGWCSDEKAIAMADLIIEHRPKLIVELGVFGGRSLIPQAMACRELGSGMVYGIDPWRVENALDGEVGKDNADWWSKLDLHGIHRGCMEAIWKYDLEQYACVIRSAAHTGCATLFKQNTIDILHIDGNHSEKASCRDVDTWLYRVRPYGFVFVDDVNWTTTAKAVAMMDAACDRVKQIEHCILFRRRGLMDKRPTKAERELANEPA